MTTTYGDAGKERYPSVMDWLPYFSRFGNPKKYVNLPTPAFGLRLIQESVDYPIDVLEFPSPSEYQGVLAKGYDIVGISFMTYNILDAIEMAKIARKEGARELWAGGYGVDTPAGIEKYFDRIFRGHAEDQVSLALINEPVKLQSIQSLWSRQLSDFPVLSSVICFPPWAVMPDADSVLPPHTCLKRKKFL